MTSLPDSIRGYFDFIQHCHVRWHLASSAVLQQVRVTSRHILYVLSKTFESTWLHPFNGRLTGTDRTRRVLTYTPVFGTHIQVRPIDRFSRALVKLTKIEKWNDISARLNDPASEGNILFSGSGLKSGIFSRRLSTGGDDDRRHTDPAAATSNAQSATPTPHAGGLECSAATSTAERGRSSCRKSTSDTQCSSRASCDMHEWQLSATTV